MNARQNMQRISELSRQTATKITNNKDNWTSYLDMAARLYKYPFSDQVLIYAQRPNATACASMDLWNNSMRRWVKKGSKGIALIERDGKKAHLKYIFDVADTLGGSKQSRSPNLWKLKKEHKSNILELLTKVYGELGEGLEAQLYGIAKNLANEHFMDYKNDLMYHVKGSYLEKLDKSTIKSTFNEALTLSIAYTLMSRCGLDTREYFVDKDFQSVQKFNTYDSIMTLGGAISELSEQILRQIEKGVKLLGIDDIQSQENKENEGSYENDSLHAERGLSDSRLSIERNGGIHTREIRNAERNLLEGAQENTLRPAPVVGKTGQPLTGDRRDGQQTSRTDNNRVTKNRPTTRKSNRPNGMGTAYERHKGSGRRDSDEGVGIQLSLFPTEQEQIKQIEGQRTQEKSQVIESEPKNEQVNIDNDIEDLVNFRITDDNLGEGGAKAKYSYNVAAIRLLKKIELENRNALPSEQEILSRYVGWGGIPQAFDSRNGDWGKEYTELQTLLTPEEYEMARASTLNAHYTSPSIIKAIYNAVEGMGFKTGNILEPACGVGNFFGLLPESMQKSKLYGVELDSVTGRIAKQLYQKANIKISGFENTNMPDSFFDLAIGNVPFGSYKVTDKKYDKHNFLIHDYFFSKTLDQVRPGGLIAFITSKGTMDKQNPVVRKYIAQRAELLGAIRLPNNAFLKNAGTEVTSDILFFKKRDRMIDIQPDWVHLSHDENGIPVNDYFVENPHMMLGQMVNNTNMYGNQNSTSCIPFPKPEKLTFEQEIKKKFEDFREKYAKGEKQNLFADRIEHSILEQGSFELSFFNAGAYRAAGGMTYLDKMFDNKLIPFLKSLNDEKTIPDKSQMSLPELLKEAIRHLPKDVFSIARNSEIDATEPIGRDSIMADPSVRNFSYTVVDGDIYYREDCLMKKQEPSKTDENRIKGLIQLRDCTRELIEYQLTDHSDNEIKQKQSQLSALYDDFTEKYGLINSRKNSTAFSNDSGYYLLCSLEILNENGELERKADMFTKRTIKQRSTVTSVNTASEALIVSIAEKATVDMDYMCELTGFSKNRLIDELKGVVFQNPQNMDSHGRICFETADKYLSGNVREKLSIARHFAEKEPEFYSENVSALEAIQPKDLTASEIDVRLGATWIDKKYVQEFMYDLLQTPLYSRSSIGVEYFSYTAEWNIRGKNVDKGVLSSVTYGTSRVNAYQILEETLNLKDIQVYDTVIGADGKESRMVNKKETVLAQQKQEMIKQAFRDWIFRDSGRREILVRKYNDTFNAIRPREYDGSHISFSGMNPEIRLRTHQLNAIAHILYGGNTLLAHEVGAGKSFEMIAAAMESKRLGLCQKSMFVVPNHIIEQMAAEFLRLYPSANILVATKKEFETQNRKKFCSRIATGEYDAIIIGHSQFEKIPMSQERQERLLKQQINDLLGSISALKRNSGEQFSIKQLEKTKRSLEAKLKKLNSTDRKDNVVTFEELGVDRLFVDEAHNYKYLFSL